MSEPRDVDEDVDVDVDAEAEASAREYEVFVSYRIDRDEPLAAALKNLIKKTLEPSPRVFVASLGGISPSAMGHRSQLLRAVQEAQVFIAIITHASKGREWINFEAGAAWGRGQIYVPLLVGTSAEDLPSTINDFQSYSARKKDKVEFLLKTIGNELGREMKPRFGSFYYHFGRALDDYLDPPADEERSTDSDLEQAAKLVREGKEDEARAIFDQCKKEAAGNPERMCEVEVERIFAFHSDVNARLHWLDEFEPELKDTANFELIYAETTRRHREAIALYRKCLERDPQELTRGLAMLGLSKRLVETGREMEARQVLLEGLGSRANDRTLVGASANNLTETLSDPLSKLLVLARGLESELPGVYQRAISLVTQQGWRELECVLTQLYDQLEDSGISKLYVGIAQTGVELMSLAYLSYCKAVEAGVSVARANIAGMHLAGPVPAAGLKLLEEHLERFDTATPGHPYKRRSEIEDHIHEERERFAEIFKRGRRCLAMLSHFVDAAFELEPGASVEGHWRFTAEPFVLALEFELGESGPTTQAEGYTVEALECLDRVIVVREDEKPRALLLPSEGSPEGLAIDLEASPSRTEWGTLRKLDD